MDIAYDHIQEEVLSPDQIASKKSQDQTEKDGNLNTEFKEAYKSFSSSPWGARLGGFFSDVRKHGENYYEGARQEATAASGEALKGFTDLKSTLVSRARSMSTGQDPISSSNAGNQPTDREAETEGKDKERSESEALRESEGVISRFRAEAAKRLKDLEKAEEAADAAIFKFGANIGNFLRDAVTIAPPTEETNKDGSRKVLFESKDQDGKRVIHSTRFDAQLHAIHSSFESFTSDPASAEYGKWKDDFDVEKKTDAVAQDLEKYEELRRTMEKLVPEKVEYKEFWTRYYFLRMVVETEEQRRREMLKGKSSFSLSSLLEYPAENPILTLPTRRRHRNHRRKHWLGRRLRLGRRRRQSLHPSTVPSRPTNSHLRRPPIILLNHHHNHPSSKTHHRTTSDPTLIHQTRRTAPLPGRPVPARQRHELRPRQRRHEQGAWESEGRGQEGRG